MKIAVITGASSGIGLSLGKEMSRDGYVVYGLSRTAPDTDTIIHVPCDVTQESSVRDAISKVIEKSGRIDVLVACAGFGVAGSIEHTKEKDMIRQMDVNVYGVVRTIQASLPYMRTQEVGADGVRGKIIVMGSLASELPLPFQGMYSMGKAALHSMTGSLLNEIYPYNIEVTCILPGDVKTNFTQKRMTDWDGVDVYSDMQKILGNAEVDENTGSNVQEIAHEIARIIRRKHLAPSYTLDRLSFWELFLTRFFSRAFVLKNIRKHYLR